MIEWIPAALVTAAAVIDWRTRLIPDWIPAALIGFATLATALGWTPTGWGSLAAGAGLGFGIGAALFATGAFGGGDAKLLCGMGAVLGPLALLAWLVHVAVCGAALALVAVAKGEKELAYAPAMALALVTTRVFGSPW